MIKNYKFGFDIWGLVLFAVIMIPNIIWTVIPAPNDVLRLHSVTGGLDTFASVVQVLFLVALCFVVNCNRKKFSITPLVIAVMCCVVIYFIIWISYYNSIVNPIVIVLLCVSPCLAFLFFALERKNIIAVIPITVFAVCHLIYGFVNFII